MRKLLPLSLPGFKPSACKTTTHLSTTYLNLCLVLLTSKVQIMMQIYSKLSKHVNAFTNTL